MDTENSDSEDSGPSSRSGETKVTNRLLSNSMRKNENLTKSLPIDTKFIKEEKLDTDTGATNVQPNSCGKDIDLKAIESEMKGLDRPIKKEEDIIGVGVAAHAYDGPRLQRLNMEKKQSQSKPQDIATTSDKPTEGSNTTASPAVPSNKSEIGDDFTPEKVRFSSDCFEDIYEFKEPEPFEIGEMRARKEGRTSRGSLASPQDEGGGDTPKNKRPKIKKEGDSDTGDADSDSSMTPKKAWEKDARKDPVAKRILKTPVKKDEESGEAIADEVTPSKVKADQVVSAGKTETDMNNIAAATATVLANANSGLPLPPSAAAAIVVPQGAVRKLPLQKKESGLPKPLHPINATDIKVVKLDMNAAGSPLSKLSQGEVVGKVTSIARPKLDLNISASTAATPALRPAGGSHIMAQVLPPKQSRALAKPVLGKDSNIKRSSSPAESLLAKGNLSCASAETDLSCPEEISKVDEKTDSIMTPFMKRQQHIFPHLLNRPGNEGNPVEVSKPSVGKQSQYAGETSLAEAIKNLPSMSPEPASGSNKTSTSPARTADVLSGPLTNNAEASCSKVDSAQEDDDDKTKAAPSSTQLSVGKSIESVIQKARLEQDAQPSHQQPNASDVDTPNSVEKKRKLYSKGKKRESMDGVDMFDAECKTPAKKLKIDGGGSPLRSSKKELSGKKPVGKRKEEEELDDKSDGDEHGADKLLASDSTPTRSLRKKAKLTPSRRSESRVNTDVDEEDDDSEDRSSSINDAGDSTDTTEGETGVGELLCDETIPPGSPVNQDHPLMESEMSMAEVQQYPNLVPVVQGSTFTKRHQHRHLPEYMTSNLVPAHENHNFVRQGSYSPSTGSQSFPSASEPAQQSLPSSRWTLSSEQSRANQRHSQRLVEDSSVLMASQPSPLLNNYPSSKNCLVDNNRNDPSLLLGGRGGNACDDDNNMAGDAVTVAGKYKEAPPANVGGNRRPNESQDNSSRYGERKTGNDAPAGGLHSALQQSQHTSLPSTPESLCSTITDSPRRYVLFL